MAISVVNPVSPAIERTQKLLFQPFDLGKWFVLGFCAWLAHLGEGGGIPPGFDSGVRYQGGGPLPREVSDWIQANLSWLIPVLVVFVVLMIALGIVLLWLSSRGHFLFVDGVVRNRAAVAEPWREYAREGNSLFWFRFWFGLACLAFVLICAAALGLLALPDIKAQRFGPLAGTALLLGMPIFFLFLFTWLLVHVFLVDFVVPIMYLRRQTAMAAWSVFSDELASGRTGTLVLYILFKIALALAVGTLALFVTCATCCLPLIPYLGTVMLLPLVVFQRAYSLSFLEQFGPAWQLFIEDVERADEDFDEPYADDTRFRE
jgi:hypothetical protein